MVSYEKSPNWLTEPRFCINILLIKLRKKRKKEERKQQISFPLLAKSIERDHKKVIRRKVIIKEK